MASDTSQQKDDDNWSLHSSQCWDDTAMPQVESDPWNDELNEPDTMTKVDTTELQPAARSRSRSPAKRIHNQNTTSGSAADKQIENEIEPTTALYQAINFENGPPARSDNKLSGIEHYCVPLYNSLEHLKDKLHPQRPMVIELFGGGAALDLFGVKAQSSPKTNTNTNVIASSKHQTTHMSVGKPHSLSRKQAFHKTNNVVPSNA
jgi:hypothetical protein